eukprot:CAMPEP_0197584820 /NCGR_PEP_ID=MMETSP1326-20131121/7311_1 /TAXON_ID=1155430 /ORGANISM="Genus nov. species nov., Strain RCC2288" /LENGTH=99 /DNA_ID=CAMNT_0043149235 /DNA_START=82 /DNA_END=381 /DNA_ORIENTATION=+
MRFPSRSRRQSTRCRRAHASAIANAIALGAPAGARAVCAAVDGGHPRVPALAALPAHLLPGRPRREVLRPPVGVRPLLQQVLPPVLCAPHLEVVGGRGY